LKEIKAKTVLNNYNLQQEPLGIVAIQNVSTVTKKLLIQTAESNSAGVIVARSKNY